MQGFYICLRLAGTKDEICASKPMAEKMIARLKNKKFNYKFERIAIEADMPNPLKHFDLAFKFLEIILIKSNNEKDTNSYQLKFNDMPNKMTHFAIHIDDIERAKNFYDGVFEWGFNSYGQSDFLQIKADKTENGELIGALQSRKYSPLPDKIIGLECTIGVENIEDIIERVKINAGQILMPKTAIPYVGWIAKFLDTEGNLICAMQYDNSAI